MPYESNDQLPKDIKDKYPREAQRTAFRKAFNQAHESCLGKGDAQKDCEGEAMAVGHSAAQRTSAGKDDSSEYAYPIAMSQEEADYKPLGASDSAGCANCRWFLSPDRCYVVSGEIAPTGISIMYMPRQMDPEPDEDEEDTEEIETIIEETMEIKERWQPLTKALLQALKQLRKVATKEPALFDAHKASGFKMYKDSQGNDRFRAWYTNAFEDLEGEIFATEALEKSVRRMQEKGQFPPLQVWHMGELTEHGQAEWVIMADRFVVADGVFYDTPFARKMKAHYAKSESGLSHGFYYEPENLREGVYYDFDTFEISTLPPPKAANPYTSFFAHRKGAFMPDYSEEQKHYLASILGAKESDALFKEASEKAQALIQQGIAFKQEDKKPKSEEEEEEKEAMADDEEKKQDNGDEEQKAINNALLTALHTLTTQNKALLERIERIEAQEAQKAANAPRSMQSNHAEAYIKDFEDSTGIASGKQIDVVGSFMQRAMPEFFSGKDNS